MSVKHAVKSKKVINVMKRKKVEVVKENIEMEENPRNTDAFLLNHVFRPPYSIIVDTNFINDCIRKKQDIEHQLMKAVNGSIKMCVTECVIGELEKLGRPFRVALSLMRDGKVQRLECNHKGTYADDCILNRVSAHRCYIVATSDTALKQRIRAIPGVPLVTYRGQRCFVERLILPTLF
ncbi:Fcf1 domain-containing protein [Ordospora colligata]|uniref:Fcf1 domain-containing protein n=1 Tax=Ordospora colligata OC4 TaxID=1354746 RepID=A0A0B2UME3_9MICR|nr:Fcf1 domain-containing protein [Ordospora colligata OC4]KHN70543.1 Fcf1 domain-containing protein [Ordospora colligata OC4]TBU17293.1 Fcf1 domain-containing protein [Ordospora colligata]TBU17543.1 Fcf1 domain-containing protein [Ordospora colligata]TBU19723.1 Fcf1 domain-containing protein [Ordospora colligata]